MGVVGIQRTTIALGFSSKRVANQWRRPVRCVPACRSVGACPSCLDSSCTEPPPWPSAMKWVGSFIGVAAVAESFTGTDALTTAKTHRLLCRLRIENKEAAAAPGHARGAAAAPCGVHHPGMDEEFAADGMRRRLDGHQTVSCVQDVMSFFVNAYWRLRPLADKMSRN